MIFKQLRQTITGTVLTPYDKNYEAVRNGAMREGRPMAIVRCRTVQDVQAAIEFARRKQLSISVRSGGHSLSGLSASTDTVVIDLSLMDKITFTDKEKNIIRLEPGARWGKVAQTLAPHHLAITAGDNANVGVGGLVTGGGIGWMVRKYGLAIDNIIGAEVITASGAFIHVNHCNHADLFWAIRGGGSNAGIVTSFDVISHPVRQVVFGTITYDSLDITKTLRGWRDYMRAAPPEVTTIARVFPPEQDRPAVVTVTICDVSSSTEQASKNCEPLLHIGNVLSNDIKPMPYADILIPKIDLPDGWQLHIKSAFVQNCSDAALERMAVHFGKASSPILELRSLGGAVSSVPSDATAFGYRDAEMLAIAHIPLPQNMSAQEMRDRMNAWNYLKSYTTGAYSGFLDTATTRDARLVYPPETYRRLAAVKKRYDPTNFFDRNYNVSPSL